MPTHMQRMHWVRTTLSLLLSVTVLAASAGFFVLANPGSQSVAHATSTAELERQKQAELEKAKQAEAKEAEQRRLAELASKRAQEAGQQINQLEGSIQSTQSSVASTQQEIATKNQEIARLESELRRIQDQQDVLVRQLYITWLSMPDDLALFTDDSVSERERRQSQFTALKKSVSIVHTQTTAAKLAVEVVRNDLQGKQAQLENLLAQQTEQRSGLASVRAVQQELQRDALGTAARLDKEAEQAKARAAEIESKLRALRATSSWGTQIVSSSNTWYYRTQTGNYTRLGPSPYTVHDYGCFITSIAMVATYHGNATTPTYIATNGSFTYSGLYYTGTPAGLGVSIAGSKKVDWNVVNSELSRGRPVIVSIYLPSIGSVNPDGSSHFVVIEDLVDGKYLMHDPLGQGRGYNMNQVVSMRIVTPN